MLAPRSISDEAFQILDGFQGAGLGEGDGGGDLRGDFRLDRG